MEIIPLINQKGGVGKTTCVINIGAILAALNNKVLFVDLDIQGNLSTGIKVKHSEKHSVYRLLNMNDVTKESTKEYIESHIQRTHLPNIDILQSSKNLAGFEFRDIFVLKKILSMLNYDYVLIDCPPSFGSIMVASILASTNIIIPLQCEFFAVKGLVALINIIKKMEKTYKTKINIGCILPTMIDTRSRLSKNILKELKISLDIPIYEPGIPRNTKIVESNSVGQPVIMYDMNCTASQGYFHFVKTFFH